ncbi:hypothetical protein [Schlesneria sp. DSM 10557]|uniref:hypothetical protein n=1 Tax=Schlesneria sp. DSM 10557 TaxID=3044399 RepID=UPI0035A19086
MHCRLIMSVGLLTLMASGCMLHGYPPGTYGSSPYVVPAQPSGSYPSGPVYQPGGTYTAPMNGAPYVPGNSPGVTTPTPLSPPGYSTPTPTYEAPTNGNSPTFSPEPESPRGRNAVPLPEDDPSERGTNRSTLTPTSHFDPSEDSTPFTQQESRRRTQAYDEESTVNSDDQEIEFEEPEIRQASGEEDDETSGIQYSREFGRTARKPVRNGGHHPQFRWVEGSVDYDESTKEWIVIYDKNPSASDQLGGVITLADTPALGRLRSGDLIRCEGELDGTTGDSRQLPVFRMNTFKRI